LKTWVTPANRSRCSNCENPARWCVFPNILLCTDPISMVEWPIGVLKRAVFLNRHGKWYDEERKPEGKVSHIPMNHSFIFIVYAFLIIFVVSSFCEKRVFVIAFGLCLVRSALTQKRTSNFPFCSSTFAFIDFLVWSPAYGSRIAEGKVNLFDLVIWISNGEQIKNRQECGIQSQRFISSFKILSLCLTLPLLVHSSHVDSNHGEMFY
jgi:hypothetical protein